MSMSLPRVRRLNTFGICLILILICVIAVALDVPVSRWVHDSGLSAALKQHWKWLLWLIRRLGHYGFTLCMVAAILWSQWPRWQDAVALAVGGALSGVNQILKWIVGRQRPFNSAGTGPFDFRTFRGGWSGLIGGGLSFPSGDTCLAFACAAVLSRIYPRWGLLFYAWAVLVALERIAEGAHYPSDTVGGAALGTLCGILAWEWIAKPQRPAEGQASSPPGLDVVPTPAVEK